VTSARRSYLLVTVVWLGVLAVLWWLERAFL
jgi:hypothetical protein